MREDARKAFTLVEMLIVIIVIGILAGLMMISSGSATDKAEETACLNNRKILQKEYGIRRAEGALTNFVLIMDDVLKDQTKGKGKSSSPTFYSISGVCPAHGVVAFALPDITDTSRVTVACTVHSDTLDDTLFVQLSKLLMEASVTISNGSKTDLKSYFNASNRVNDPNATLDSTGPNFGMYFVEYLKNVTGIDLSSYPWQVQRKSTELNDKGNYDYSISWTTQNISNLKDGTWVSVTQYDTETGTTVTGKAQVSTKKVDDKTIKVVDMSNFKPDPH
ncbi:prepilin-type N-terminal cleavage/methylation domain-containing protein [Cloacibacillus porcorum]|uniref:prepilin-type N-terminal cleavage/methylation domain-containing protein n=1 Tax=Cloacibacillus porcorum TaxID=1197717 RepID=UPI0023F51EC8|nr:prepilin-type N-terminal cleavage/methylation domain-containing protein [Cloacibacillus porcorum]MDD7648867.1 prepilin-type N-terminal cleavage/methylation domain-containing protein [Cloacibacillus porcorum]MDY4094879.1 prepilin-type N-terminal cleavage/methylation domain-containing protein [Cloacibacillus porcorum]